MYGITPALFYPIRSQYSRNLQQADLLLDRFERGSVKRATLLFNSFCSNVGKQVARYFARPGAMQRFSTGL